MINSSSKASIFVSTLYQQGLQRGSLAKGHPKLGDLTPSSKYLSVMRVKKKCEPTQLIGSVDQKVLLCAYLCIGENCLRQRRIANPT